MRKRIKILRYPTKKRDGLVVDEKEGRIFLIPKGWDLKLFVSKRKGENE